MLRLCHYLHTQEVSETETFGPKDYTFSSTTILSSISDGDLLKAEFYTWVTIYENDSILGLIVVIDVKDEKKFVITIIKSNEDICFTCEIFKEIYFDDNETLAYLLKNIGIKSIKFTDLPNMLLRHTWD